MDRALLIDALVEREWEMFSTVQNVGGSADCQHEPETFRIMRTSQLNTWDQDLLESYLCDLQEAKEKGRNLMTEKYAHMMRETFPDEYEAIKKELPPVSGECERMINEIVRIHITWQKEVAERYPLLLSHARPAHTEGGHIASLETYLRGELLTYSEKTVRLYYEKTLAKANRGDNEAQENLLNQVKQYGFDSLDACEAHLASKKKRA
ncbi:MAG: DUF4125 family protein [Desulfovibrio sp.]|nr:DUF4125 family protein [Desulfovibrio sp.]